MKAIATALLLGLCMACTSQKPSVSAVERTRPLMVYRTVHDLHDRVPVGLDAERRHIISYPQPKDLQVDGKLLLPTKLQQGWWLDNKGIGLNTGFLRLTYTEYAALPEAPPLAEMEAMLLERDPLEALCDCGTQGSMADPVMEINALLKKGKLRERCKMLK